MYMVAEAMRLSTIRKNLYKTEEQPASILIPSPKHLHSRLWNTMFKIPLFIDNS